MPKTVALAGDLNGRKPPHGRFCAGTFRTAAYSEFAHRVTAEPEDCAFSQPFFVGRRKLGEEPGWNNFIASRVSEDSSDAPAEETLALS